MALNSLSEILSVTDNAVKSLNSSNGSRKDVNVLKHGGSPFNSPRSSRSVSDSGIEKTKSKSEPSFPRGIESQSSNTAKNGGGMAEIRSVKVKKDSDPNYSEQEFQPKNNASHGLNKSIESQRSQSSGKSSNFSAQSKSVSSGKKLKNVYVERHGHGHGDNSNGKTNTSLSKENVAECSMDKISATQEENGIDSSSSSNDQPQIIDVVSRDFQSGNQSSENESSHELDKVSEVNHKKDDFAFVHKSFGKTLNANCPSLKQGDLNKGFLDPTKAKVFDDVHISQFQLTEKQRDLKEALAKRSENNQPKRKQVQPQIIQHKHIRNGDSCSDDLDSVSDTTPIMPMHTANPTTNSAMTAAVAASAAVAATQPFLKIQHDLESQIKQLVNQLAAMQQSNSSATSDPSANGKTSAGKRISDLEQQVAELTERRLEHVESLQQQQLQMQAQLLMMSRSRSPRTELYSTKRQKSPHRGTHNASHIPLPVGRESKSIPLNSYVSSSHHLDSGLGQSQSSVFNPNTLSKHHNYLSEVRELQGSLLDTPAPRKNVPQPTPYILPDQQHKHLGFLQELLDKKGTPSHDTTFSVAPGYEQNMRLHNAL